MNISELPPDRSRLVPTEGGRVYVIDRGPLESELPVGSRWTPLA